MIGSSVSALANSAALLGKDRAYFVWGIENGTHHIIGTTFKPRQKKIGSEDFEPWLARFFSPGVEFRFHEFMAETEPVVLLEIWACTHTPVKWKNISYIRVGSACKKLNDYPEKERALWLQFSYQPFEQRIARSGITDDEVLHLLDYDAYFRLMKQNLPATKKGILDRLQSEKMLVHHGTDKYDITNFGAILFARHLSDFEILGRKAVRVIDYAANDRLSGGREYVADSGYAAIFESLIAYIQSRLPNNEHIGQALRFEIEMYPEIAIRELVPNAIIHQDLDARGDSPFVEIFRDRIEITNPGLPLIDTSRFIDEPPQSRNEVIAAFMRRAGICEERGSGIDKVIQSVEIFQLPPPDFTVTERHTRVYLYAHKPFKEMTSKERMRACYQHVCLMFVIQQPATNASLRKRFSLEDEDYKTVSKIISNTIADKSIKLYDPENLSRRHARYVPFWA